ncbi:MAG TPA: acyltransferase [Blastocatellia bacterium]|nr:acyltransferase [Blastocatellia bacterium]
MADLTSKPSARIPELDGIRGLAILEVLIFHYSGFLPASPGTPLGYLVQCLSLTWSGVDLFFVLSGFLISGILFDNRSSANYFSVFYVRRFLRILPLYYGLVLFFKMAGGESLQSQMLPLIVYATFTQTLFIVAFNTLGFWLSISWSLAVEEQFYALLPVTIRYVDPRRLPALFVSSILFACALRAILLLCFPIDRIAIVIHGLLPCRLDAFALGALCAWAVRKPVPRQWLAGHIKLLYLALLVPFTVLAFCIKNGWGLYSPAMILVGYISLAIFYALLLMVAILESRGVVKWITTTRPLRFLGTLAYGLYLLHLLVPRYVFAAFGRTQSLASISDWAIFALSMAVLFLLTASLWRYFEKPLINLGHRWKYAGASPVNDQMTATLVG